MYNEGHLMGVTYPGDPNGIPVAPLMEELHAWLEAQFAERKTEPNSGLGKAISYLLRHWKGLKLFLREAWAPLDNNRVERALKRAVLHRKNACSIGP